MTIATRWTLWSTVVLVWLSLTCDATAQATRIWLDEQPVEPPYTIANASHVIPYPGGGVITASLAILVPSPASDGEATIRRLTENGDVVWEITRSLVLQDYIGLNGREYIAGLAVSEAGTVAVAFGSAGPMEIRLLEADGSERWRRDVPVTSGPHFDDPSVVVAAGGDVVFAASEGLYQGSTNGLRFVLYRFDGDTGTTRWMTSAPSWNRVQLSKDTLGGVILGVNRRSTDRKVWSLEYHNPQGLVTATRLIDTDSNFAGIRDIEVDVTGRTVLGIGEALNMTVLSLDASFAEEWTTVLPVGASIDVTLMEGGDAVVTGIALNYDIVRLERATGTPTFAAANVVGRSYFSHAAPLPNGNCVVGLYKYELADGFCLQERDSSGGVVQSFLPPTSLPSRLYGLAAGERGNLYAAYGLGTGFDPSASGIEKISFEGPEGASYCGPAVPNSTGQPAEARAVGSNDVSVNNLSLLFSNLPPGALVLPLASKDTGFVTQAGGSQGNLCLGGSVGRFDEPGEVRVASPLGLASLQVELLRMPTPTGLVPAMAGETWNFQAWFRDSLPGIPSTSNFTDAVAVQF